MTGIYRDNSRRYICGMDATISTDIPEPRSLSIRLPRPLWIGVAGCIMIVVAVGLQFGLPIYRQHVAIKAIKQLGGIAITERRGPAWLQRMIGEKVRLFDVVTEVALPRATDATLAEITWLPSVKIVNFSGTPVTDAGLVHLMSLTGLQELHLEETQVSDGGLGHLTNAVNLQELYLQGTLVTDMGFGKLAGLSVLERLDLSGTRITDAGLPYLKGLTRLRILVLSDTQVTDAGLEQLKALTRLEGLDLRNTRVTDAGVKNLGPTFPAKWVVH